MIPLLACFALTTTVWVSIMGILRSKHNGCQKSRQMTGKLLFNVAYQNDILFSRSSIRAIDVLIELGCALGMPANRIHQMLGEAVIHGSCKWKGIENPHDGLKYTVYVECPFVQDASHKRNERN